MRLRSLTSALMLVLFLSAAASATSIVFPAFTAPVFMGDDAFFAHTYGKVILCYDTKNQTLRWRRKIRSDVIGLELTPDKTLLALLDREVQTLDPATGNILAVQKTQGTPIALANNRLLCRNFRDDLLLTCIDLPTNRVQWTFSLTDRDMSYDIDVAGMLAFIHVSPRRSGQNGHELYCIRLADGGAVWREPLPTPDLFGWIGARRAERFVICWSDQSVRLLDPMTGEIQRRFPVEGRLAAVTTWNTDKLVLGFDTADHREPRLIRIVSLDDFQTLGEFTAPLVELSSMETLDDMLLTGSLYRQHGIDLKSGRILWESFQRWQIMHEGKIYFGAPGNEQKIRGKRLFGVADPRTGESRILYVE